jgi:hypothetical protein
MGLWFLLLVGFIPPPPPFVAMRSSMGEEFK